MMNTNTMKLLNRKSLDLHWPSKYYKYILLTIVFCCCNTASVWACDVCRSNQPKGFEDITHGRGPTGVTDYIITWIAIVIVLATLFLSIKYLVKPKEDNTDHIKNLILNEN